MNDTESLDYRIGYLQRDREVLQILIDAFKSDLIDSHTMMTLKNLLIKDMQNE